jgi:hypothetical protein
MIPSGMTGADIGMGNASHSGHAHLDRIAAMQ